jgi:hypothetical protein
MLFGSVTGLHTGGTLGNRSGGLTINPEHVAERFELHTVRHHTLPTIEVTDVVLHTRMSVFMHKHVIDILLTQLIQQTGIQANQVGGTLNELIRTQHTGTVEVVENGDNRQKLTGVTLFQHLTQFGFLDFDSLNQVLLRVCFHHVLFLHTFIDGNIIAKGKTAVKLFL